MPLTPKGKEIMSSMKKQYGSKKGKSVFYASKNSGKITGVDKGFYGHIYPDQLEHRAGAHVGYIGTGENFGGYI